MSRKIFRSFFVLILVIGLAAVQAPQSAHAAGPWYVSTTGDDNNACLSSATPCATINGAISKAAAGDTINVAVGTYTGTSSEVVLIDRDITLSGGWDAVFTTQSGMSIIDGETVRRGVTANGGVTVTFEHFTIQNGLSSDGGGGILNAGNAMTLNNSVVNNNQANGGFSADVYGGGIYNAGILTINNSTISNNTADGPGGGIFNYNGRLILSNSTIAGNIAGQSFWGGGIYGNGTLILNNSTVSGNSVMDGGGGGIFAWQNGPVTVNLNNSTISNNTAYQGGGIAVDPTAISPFFSVNLKNSIVAGNSGVVGPDCSGLISSSGYNLIGDTSDCNFTLSTTDLINIDPLLGPLQDNGGPTFTHALLPGSPAIDAGNPAGCTDQDGNPLTTDQRGIARPQGTACDIGAFELEAVSQAIQVTIDIRPGSRTNNINLKHDLLIPVAILSTADFNAPKMVDRNSLTFGKTGDEDSLLFCLKHGIKVNRDRFPDLVCYFRVSRTGFEFGDTEGILKGMTVENISFEGSDSVKILKNSEH